jgi:hypothetical protein
MSPQCHRHAAWTGVQTATMAHGLSHQARLRAEGSLCMDPSGSFASFGAPSHTVTCSPSPPIVAACACASVQDRCVARDSGRLRQSHTRTPRHACTVFVSVSLPLLSSLRTSAFCHRYDPSICFSWNPDCQAQIATDRPEPVTSGKLERADRICYEVARVDRS